MSRKQIRAYVTEKLKGKTMAANRVYNSKVNAYARTAVFPMISVYVTEEKVIGLIDINPPVKQRVEGFVEIEILTKQDNFADDVDDIDEEIRQEIDYHLGELVLNCMWYGIDIKLSPSELEYKYAIGKALYRYERVVIEPLPKATDDLKEIHINWDMINPSNIGGGPDQQIDAEDVIAGLDE